MEHQIIRWEIPDTFKLRITVASKPLDMAKTFIWQDYTSNHYGQGSKWAWWVAPTRNDEALYEVKGDAAELLTKLVYSHEPLKHLVKHFRMPDPNSYEMGK